MRAIFQKKFNENDKTIPLSNEQIHHLNIVRIKHGEKILLLDGNGTIGNGTLIKTSNKEFSILLNSVERVQKFIEIDLFLGVPKKKYFESILQISTELGINKIYPVESQYSQYKYQKSERYDKILESALIQSNNPFMTTIMPPIPFGHIKTLAHEYESTVYFSPQSKNPNPKLKNCKKTLYLIGPEGGFSTEEEKALSSLPSCRQITLPTPLLRSPTAVATAMGYLLANLEM